MTNELDDPFDFNEREIKKMVRRELKRTVVGVTGADIIVRSFFGEVLLIYVDSYWNDQASIVVRGNDFQLTHLKTVGWNAQEKRDVFMRCFKQLAKRLGCTRFKEAFCESDLSVVDNYLRSC